MALGATPASVLVLVIGTVVGVAGALGLTQYLATLLYGVSATDVRTFVLVVIGLGLAASSGEFLAVAPGGWAGSDGCATAPMTPPSSG
jgi:hypothetical protein